MSRDIRSFFTVLSKKSGTDSKPTTTTAPKKKKTKRIVDSDEDDVVPATPERKKSKRVVVSSDSENEKVKTPSTSRKRSSPKKKQSPVKLKPVSVAEVFKSTPIKQSKVEFVPKPEEKTPKNAETENNKKSKKSKSKAKKELEVGVHNDASFENTLRQIDEDDLFERNMDSLLEVESQALAKLAEGAKESPIPVKKSAENKKDVESLSSDKKPDKSPPKEKKRSRTDSPSDKFTPKKKPKMEHTDSGIDPGQAAHEKKRECAMLYQRYLNRGGPKHHGSKEIPEGKPNCLRNLCFLRTGVLDSLDSEEFSNLISKHGGRVVQAVSKKVDYVVVGEDAGPAKLAKAESYNIPRISEDQLLDLILVKSGKPPKYAENNDESFNSADLGIGSENSCKPDSDSEAPEQEPKTSQKTNLKKLSEKPTKSNEKEAVKTNGDSKSATTSTHKELDKHPKVVDSTCLSLTEKYKPTTLRAIIGQQGDNSNMNKLKSWLLNWHENQEKSKKKLIARPSLWAQNDNGAYYKCALLSGPPGVGKTTTATLVAQELGLDIVEFNASDTRSKKLLHEHVSQLLSTNTIAGFASGGSNVNSKRVLLMDEVDGMAGNEDRGGMQELILLIKNSHIPIICMCNDRSHQKMRSLVNYCYDLRFTKPKLGQIQGAMMTVCFKEGIKMEPKALAEIIEATGCDVRQTLNHISIFAASGNTDVTAEQAEKEAKSAHKDKVMGPWEVIRAVFTKSDQKDMSLMDKSRLFFYDYSMGPLFVQENYLKVQPSAAKTSKEALLRAAKAADAISMGDVIDAKIRRTNNWSLLDTQSYFSSVFPGYFMSGQFTGQINFPGWLGKNSKKNKFSRIISEIQAHTRTTAHASKLSVKLDLLLALRNAVVTPLVKKGASGVQEAVDAMKEYNLLRDDLDGILEVTNWRKGSNNPMSKVDSKVKSAFTRTYNKQVNLLPFVPQAKKKSTKDDNLLLDEEEVDDNADSDDDDISKNAMIKVKTRASDKKNVAGPSKKKTEPKNKGKGRKK